MRKMAAFFLIFCILGCHGQAAEDHWCSTATPTPAQSKVAEQEFEQLAKFIGPKLVETYRWILLQYLPPEQRDLFRRTPIEFQLRPLKKDLTIFDSVGVYKDSHGQYHIKLSGSFFAFALFAGMMQSLADKYDRPLAPLRYWQSIATKIEESGDAGKIGMTAMDVLFPPPYCLLHLSKTEQDSFLDDPMGRREMAHNMATIISFVLAHEFSYVVRQQGKATPGRNSQKFLCSDVAFEELKADDYALNVLFDSGVSPLPVSAFLLVLNDLEGPNYSHFRCQTHIPTICRMKDVLSYSRALNAPTRYLGLTDQDQAVYDWVDTTIQHAGINCGKLEDRLLSRRPQDR